MIKKLFFAAFASLLSVSGFAQQVKHVILITIDGFRPDFYLDTAWHASNLQKLLNNGVYAKGVNSVFASVTYPAHSTIITGVQPAKHGVYSNAVFEPLGATGKIYWSDTSLHSPTLWQAAKQHGLKTASLFWPVSAGAPVDYNIPDIGALGESFRETHTKPAGFISEIKREVFGSADTIEYGKDQNVARIAAYLIKKEMPGFMNVHLFSVDEAEHEEGRQGNKVKAAIADADEAVGIIEAAIKEQEIWNSTVLIVTGDHGFYNYTKKISPNIWLKNAGLMNDLKKDDWKAQFNTVSGGCAYLYLKDKNDTLTENRVRNLLKALPDSTKQMFRIIEKSKLIEFGANPEAVFALSALNNTAFDKDFEGESFKVVKGGTHGHFPDSKEIQTGFIIYGSGIKRGGMIAFMNLKDIAPIVARLLGFPFPSSDGKIPAGIF